jgi:hypothetical protein
MPSEDAADDIFVDLDAKRVSNLLGNSRTPESRIVALHFEDRRDEFLRGPFGPWSLTGSGRESGALGVKNTHHRKATHSNEAWRASDWPWRGRRPASQAPWLHERPMRSDG